MSIEQRLQNIRRLAHGYIDEIECIVISEKGLDVACRPKPEQLRNYHRILDGVFLILASNAAGWNGGHQEDKLEAIGLVNQVIAKATNFPAGLEVRTKFRSFDQLFCRAKSDEWVPPMADQLKGAKPIGRSQMN